jgi:hypothetical protein
MNSKEKKNLLEEEELIILHSGEIPEVTCQGSIYYLSKDPDGPGLELNNEEILFLKKPIITRYLRIIRRDLTPRNRDLRLYRGLARAAVNWQRLEKFSKSEKIQISIHKIEVAVALKSFLSNEVEEVNNGIRKSSVNCTREELEIFTRSLNIQPENLPEGWQNLCP